MKIKKGTTRLCILISNHAIKIPKFLKWKTLIHGIIDNKSENENWKNARKYHRTLYAKVRFCSWFGLILIMKRCKTLTAEQYNSIDISRFKSIEPIDNKIENFGRIPNTNHIVLVDYAKNRYAKNNNNL